MSSLSQELARFVVETKFEDLPEVVVHEAKRALLDSIGCALAGIATDKGKISIELARRLGGPPESSIIGMGDKVSCCNAAFANGELINALEYDAVEYDALFQPAGHVSPYVIPAPLAVAESVGASGRELILATVLGHEISVRIAGSMKREILSPAFGYSLCIMGAAVGAGKILKLDHRKMPHAFGIAGHFCPVPTFVKWAETVPSAMTKYGSTGWVSAGAVTAALMAEMGYVGDTTALDGEHGLWRFLTSGLWEPDTVVEKIGQTWRFLEIQYKLYPSCGAYLGVLDCFTSIIDKNNLMPEDIESVKVFGSPFVEKPLLKNNKLTNHVDAQFSGAYVFATAAHRVKVGAEWQDLDTMRNPNLLEFMKKVSFQVYPEYEEEIGKHPRSGFLGMVEVMAKGKTFREKRLYARGTPFTDVKATDEELVRKFRHNASRILTQDKIDAAVKSLLELETVENVPELVKQVTL